ncbi:MAG TPA: gluconokinase [Vicinamibacterales bacterium]|nr:gluconokinase [Vicinamibacterales bacterium]
MAGPTVLALDIGTSSVRASIYDRRPNALSTTQLRYKLDEHQDGRVEIDPLALERVTMQAIDRVLASRPGPVQAVATAAFWHSLMGVDAGNIPVTPLLPWSDLRAHGEVARLRTLADERRAHARTGCRFHASYWPARWLWYRRRDARTLRRVARWVGFTDWLERRWLGRDGVSISQASGTGVLDQDACAWDRRLLEICGVDPASVAPLVDTDCEEGELRPQLARRWPALARARWVPAVGDGALNNLGAGCVRRGRAALMIGTSGAVRVLWQPAPDERVVTGFGLWRYRLDRRRVVVGGALSNGGNAREWVLRICRAPAGIERAAAGMPPDSHGLTMIPYFAGTRSPDYLPYARAALAGLSLATTPAQLLRATMEAIAYRFALVVRELEQVAAVREVVAAGGALERSPAWVQIIADVLGRRIQMCRPRELTSGGAAALALDRLGEADLSRLRPVVDRTIVPDQANRRTYDRALERHVRFAADVAGF